MKPLEDPALAAARLRGLLIALHLGSPALPVGGYAYSQGLEKAIDDGLVHDADSAHRWIEDLLLLVLARWEAPLWLRAYDATARADDAAFAAINATLLASRETAELRLESQQMGASLAQIFPAFGLTPPPAPLAYPAAFAALCAGLQIERELGLATFLWSWAENQVLAAVKTIPLGQAAGQRLLAALHSPLTRAVTQAAGLDDEELGSAPLGFAIESARHETQYARLYRS
ncbi:MAG: urease accessory UreF family protein [Sutterellaceae bacterium]|nr:urease accessory protein UreF [Burkholderiaceae bacterium]MDW8429229.1 urease accessory UreF family protein [Sutterellaceae bacterium]